MAKVKVLITILCLSSILYLTGCMTSEFNYELDVLKEEVIGAEIVEVIGTEIVEVIDGVNKEYEINTLNLISANDLEEMLTDLSNLQYIWTKGRPQRANGVCLQLNYTNEEYELICENIVMKFNGKNQRLYVKDIYKPKGWGELISKYKIE